MEILRKGEKSYPIEVQNLAFCCQEMSGRNWMPGVSKHEREYRENEAIDLKRTASQLEMERLIAAEDTVHDDIHEAGHSCNRSREVEDSV